MTFFLETHTYSHTLTHSYVPMCAHTCAHTHTHAHTYTHSFSHILTHVHAHTLFLVLSLYSFKAKSARLLKEGENEWTRVHSQLLA